MQRTLAAMAITAYGGVLEYRPYRGASWRSPSFPLVLSASRSPIRSALIAEDLRPDWRCWPRTRLRGSYREKILSFH